MEWLELGKKIVKLGAPLLGSVVGGPAGGAIGAVIASAVGADPDDPTDIAIKLDNDPGASEKLLSIQMNAKVELERLAAENARLILQDKANARNREIEMAKSGQKDWTPPILAIIVSSGYFGLIYCLAFKNIQADAIVLMKEIVASLTTIFTLIASYYFGSSFGSRQKDKAK